MGTDLMVPAQRAPIAAASSWLNDLLTGELAVSLAVIAIAFLGFAMLAGRIELRTALRTILGCFVLFGAPTIANSLVGAVRSPIDGRSLDESPRALEIYSSPEAEILPPAGGPRANPFDPYSSVAPAD